MPSVKIGSAYCSVCGKQVKCERHDNHIGVGGVFLRIILACFFLVIPLVGWIFSILCLISIFWDTSEGSWHCSFCGSVLEGNAVQTSEKKDSENFSPLKGWLAAGVTLVIFTVILLAIRLSAM